jgi:hypothetical protein
VHAQNAGKQYISVSSPPGRLSQLPYQVAVNLISAQGGEGNLDSVQFGEVEPNDNWTMATQLTRDVPRFGQTRSLSDVDWYVTETYENNTLMNIWFPGSEDSWDVEVQDARGEILATFSTVSDGATQTNYQVHAPNAGKQYISISSPGQLNESPYQVAVNLISAQGGEGSPDTTQFGEVEPNDIWTMATELTRDVPRFGQTRSLDDVDWYVINTHDNNSLMNVWFPGSDNTWNVEVQDANGAVLAEFPTVSDGITQTNQQVHAPNAGPQYIKITSPTGQLNQSNYQLAVNITGAEGGEGSPGYVYSGETEPNDYLLAADLLEPDQTIIGQSYAPDDVDWYMVEADANNTLFEFIFDNTATDFDIPNPVVTWDAEFTDSEGNVLASFTTLPGQLFSYEAQAPNAGNYYLRLVKTESTAVGFTDQPYRVTLVVTNEAGGSTQPNYNFYDVERENNDLFSRAKGLGSQESIINVKGQVMHDDDRDFFRIDSPNGNEIIKIEMCPQGTECYEDLNYGTPGSFAMLPWAVYLFDGAKVNDAFLNPYETKWYDASYGLDWVEIPLSPREIEEAREDEKCTPDVDYSPSGGISAACRNFELQGIPGWIPVESDHLFYLARFGVFGDGLIGMIDPTRPLNETNNSAWREISFAVQDPGIYYVGVSSVLAPSETYDNWEVVTREEEIDEEPDILVIKNLNYTADQYTFRITRTQLTPNYHDSGNDGRLGSDVEGGSNKDVKAILRGMSPFF